VFDDRPGGTLLNWTRVADDATGGASTVATGTAS